MNAGACTRRSCMQACGEEKPQTQANVQTCIENCLRLTRESCFWSSYGRYLRPLWFNILATLVCVSECISLNTSHTLSSPTLNGIIHCSSIWFVWTLGRLGSVCLLLLIRARKLIIDFIKLQGCGPLAAKSEKLEGTLSEWIHFLHNPPQSSSRHPHASGEPMWHIKDYCAMLSLDANTQWPVKCSWTKPRQAVMALMRELCIHGVNPVLRWSTSKTGWATFHITAVWHTTREKE